MTRTRARPFPCHSLEMIGRGALSLLLITGLALHAGCRESKPRPRGKIPALRLAASQRTDLTPWTALKAERILLQVSNTEVELIGPTGASSASCWDEALRGVDRRIGLKTEMGEEHLLGTRGPLDKLERLMKGVRQATLRCAKPARLAPAGPFRGAVADVLVAARPETRAHVVKAVTLRAAVMRLAVAHVLDTKRAQQPQGLLWQRALAHQHNPSRAHQRRSPCLLLFAGFKGRSQITLFDTVLNPGKATIHPAPPRGLKGQTHKDPASRPIENIRFATVSSFIALKKQRQNRRNHYPACEAVHVILGPAAPDEAPISWQRVVTLTDRAARHGHHLLVF